MPLRARSATSARLGSGALQLLRLLRRHARTALQAASTCRRELPMPAAAKPALQVHGALQKVPAAKKCALPVSLGSGALQQVQSSPARVSVVPPAGGVTRQGLQRRPPVLPVALARSAMKRERRQLRPASSALLEPTSRSAGLQRRAFAFPAPWETSAVLRASLPAAFARKVLTATPLA